VTKKPSTVERERELAQIEEEYKEIASTLDNGAGIRVFHGGKSVELQFLFGDCSFIAHLDFAAARIVASALVKHADELEVQRAQRERELAALKAKGEAATAERARTKAAKKARR
jgi:S-adenosylhomocysteine hydrolase